VIQIDNASHRVTVGSDAEATTKTLPAQRDLNWVAIAELRDTMRVRAKIRHRHEPAWATRSAQRRVPTRSRAVFDEPQRAVTRPVRRLSSMTVTEVVGGGWDRLRACSLLTAAVARAERRLREGKNCGPLQFPCYWLLAVLRPRHVEAIVRAHVGRPAHPADRVQLVLIDPEAVEQDTLQHVEAHHLAEHQAAAARFVAYVDDLARGGTPSAPCFRLRAAGFTNSLGSRRQPRQCETQSHVRWHFGGAQVHLCGELPPTRCSPQTPPWPSRLRRVSFCDSGPERIAVQKHTTGGFVLQAVKVAEWRNGFSSPPRSSVETKAIGRGTITPIISL